MRNRIFYLLFILLGVFIYACGGGADSEEGSVTERTKEQLEMEEDGSNAMSEENNKGIGEVQNVSLNDPLDMEMVKNGKAIYEMKCASCHKLTDQRVVGPGWKGLTDKRTPEWIMNMITNVDVMLAEDPEAQRLLEECLVRMPDQNVSVGDARDILEYMYYNDGKNIPEDAEM